MVDISLPYRRAQPLVANAMAHAQAAKTMAFDKMAVVTADEGVRRCTAYIVTLDAGRTMADAFFYQLSPRAMALQFMAGLAGMLAGAAGANIIRRQVSPKTSPNGVEALAAVGGAEFAMQATSRLLLG